MNYWLFKSEPDSFSIDDLAAMPGKKDHWDGIRNYQARNLIRDEMRKGDMGFFYHSSCPVPGVVGVVTITSNPYHDHTALDPKQKYYDPKATEEDPRWFMVDVKYKKKFKQIITLDRLKSDARLKDMRLVQRGNRLSVMPVTAREWKLINSMAS